MNAHLLPKGRTLRNLTLRAAAAVIVSLLAAHGALAQKVTMEFDQAADFSKYRTFAIRDGRLNSKKRRAQQRPGEKTDRGGYRS